MPTLSGFGVICSSICKASPDPNWICNVDSSKNLVTNLLFVDLVLNMYGASLLSL